MSGLRWREGEHRDRRALDDFICTKPVARRAYGRAAPPRQKPWELEAQGLARNLRPPARAHEYILIGEDGGGIGAVAAAESDDGWASAYVQVLAVALRLRGHGHHGQYRSVGDELIDELVNRIASKADAAGHGRLLLWGKVDPRNGPSLSVCARSGAIVDEHSGPYHVWVNRIDFE